MNSNETPSRLKSMPRTCLLALQTMSALHRWLESFHIVQIIVMSTACSNQHDTRAAVAGNR